MVHSKEERLEEIYTRTNQQVRKSRIYLIFAGCLFIIAVSVPSIEQLSFPPYDSIVPVIAIFACLFLFFKSSVVKPSYEKRLFRQIFSIYQEFSGHLKISDVSTIKKKNLNSVISPLNKLSNKLRKTRIEGNSDLIAETNRKYAVIGQQVKTKIIAYLQKNKDLEIVKRRILRLANVFSDANMTEVSSYIESIKDIPDEEFHAIPSKFDTIKTTIVSNPLLRIGGEYAVCLAFVTGVAYFLSMVLSKSLADWGGYILVASFALLATWERARS